MRILVACPQCQRQWDASGREAGSRFHCSCGALVTVPRGRGHDAAVVRCSGCGGPREAGATACAFCGADFTLHERDLHTLCPGCFARVSDRARFCHHCASPLAPQGGAGAAVEERCPSCEEEVRLVSRSLGGRRLTVLECGRCGGLWLGEEVFRLVESEARREAASGEQAPARLPPVATDPQQGRFYRPCPTCGQLMHRRNYGRKSGFIIDVCRDHGIWFDPGELDGVLRWVRDGGLVVTQRREREVHQQEERRRRLAERMETPDPFNPWDRGRQPKLGDFLVDLVSHLF